MEDKKLHIMIHSKNSTSNMCLTTEYDHVSIYDNSRPCGKTEIARFYIRDLLFMNEIISHYTNPISKRANQLSDALYPRDWTM